VIDTISDQHKHLPYYRQSKDLTDTRVMVVFLNERIPFEDVGNSLPSIGTGMVAKPNAHFDAAKIVGDKILNKMAGGMYAHIFIHKEKSGSNDGYQVYNEDSLW